MRYVFGDYTFDAEQYALCRSGLPVPVEPRVFTLLAYLLQHAGRVVLTEELLAQLYPQEFAPVERLTNTVAQARKILQDTGQTQRYIQTVRSRGYRFIAPVHIWLEQDSELEGLNASVVPAPPVEQCPSAPDAVSSPPLGQPGRLNAPSFLQETQPGFQASGYSLLAAERRQLTVLVCRLVSAAEDTAPLDPEVLFEVAPDYHAMCAEIVQQFAGQIAQHQGDRLLVYFGYPQAHEDDARRAVHTGLRIVAGMAGLNQRRPHTMGIPLAVRIGIHTGIVVVSTIGHDTRALLALGETPTIATQVQDLAAHNTVVISQATLPLIAGAFVAEHAGVHRLMGLAQPLTVSRVIQERKVHSQPDVFLRRRQTLFVGRDQELGLLQERWTQARDGVGQVVVLSGEAGIGKSRLVQVLQEHLMAEVYTSIICHCSPYHQNTAFYPLREYFQQCLQVSRGAPPDEALTKLEAALASYGFDLESMVPLFSALLGIPLPARYPPLAMDPPQMRQQTQEAVLAWLLKETTRQPVCIVVEDLHWADPSTLEFCSLLLPQVPTIRVLMLLICRLEFHPPWANRSHLSPLVLGRLPRRQVEKMVYEMTEGKPLPVEVLQQLVDKTDGVPLFVEELTKTVLEGGLVQERAGRYELITPLPLTTIPATLHDSLMARLDRLGEAKQVAQLGATIGREFPYELLQAVVPLDAATLQQALTQLVEAELLYQRGVLPQARYVFKHILVQETAYQSLIKSIRQSYHQRIAQLLAERFPETTELEPELLAHHYTEAGLQEQAITYWQQAGQRAIERSANLEAISHFTKGLELLKALPETPERIQQELRLQLALGSPLLMLKGHTAPEVEHTYARAYELAQQLEDTPQRFSALVGLWRLYLSQARLQTARELGEQCFLLAQRRQDPALLQQAHQMLGSVLFYMGELGSALAHLEQGIALYDPQRCHPQAPVGGTDPGVVCLSWAAWTLWLLGYPDRALARSCEALTLAQKLSHAYSLAFALHFGSSLDTWRRDVQGVSEKAEAVLALASERGFVRWMGGGQVKRGWVLAERGSMEEGIGQLRQGLAIWQSMGGELGLPSIVAKLTEAYRKSGQVDLGLRAIAEAMTVVDKNMERYYEAELYRLKGELLLLQATPDEQQAEISFRHALDIAHHQQAKSWELRAVMSLSRLWQKQGRREEAYQMLAGLYDWFTEGFDTPDLQEAKTLLEALAGIECRLP